MKDLYIVSNDPEGDELMTKYPDDFANSRPAEEKDLTLGRMAQFLDQAAEAENKHDFVGCHTALSGLMLDKVGAKNARAIMRRLFEVGGLHELK